MTVSAAPAQWPALEALRDQIAVLSRATPKEIRAGHLDLGPDLWLSCDPEGLARMCTASGEDGVTLKLEAAESSRWACLGMRLQGLEVARARYAGILVKLRSSGIVSYRPTLRYVLPNGGVHDVTTPDPVVLLPGARESLSHIPVDAELVRRAVGCEFNLFFLGEEFQAEGLYIEPLFLV